MSEHESQHAVVIGASYAGLCAAAALQANGWKTTVLERSAQLLRSGGGVVVQRRMADYLEAHSLASPGITSVPARMRMIYQPDGGILRLPETAKSYTAWDVLLREFERTVGAENIYRGRELERIDQTPEKAIAVLADGDRIEGDLLVAADGVGSKSRSLLLPGSEPSYAGYVAWRGTVDERELPEELRANCADAFCSFTGDHTNIVAYEIPGPDGSVEIGQRRVNWVWYLNVAPGDELDCLLVGSSGRKKRSTLPRGEARPETVRRMLQSASDLLPPKFVTIIEATSEPFAQAILDYQAPQLFFGRSVLIGDAACLIRPHLGAGTAKAVEDAVSLADAACGPDFRERGCLRAWEQIRLEEHDALAEQAKAVARRSGLGLGAEAIEATAGANGTRSRTA